MIWKAKQTCTVIYKGINKVSSHDRQFAQYTELWVHHIHAPSSHVKLTLLNGTTSWGCKHWYLVCKTWHVCGKTVKHEPLHCANNSVKSHVPTTIQWTRDQICSANLVMMTAILEVRSEKSWRVSLPPVVQFYALTREVVPVVLSTLCAIDRRAPDDQAQTCQPVF